MYTTVLFDFDGTLTPSLEFWVEAYGYALAEHKITLSEDELIRRCFYQSYAEITKDFGIATADPKHDFGGLVEYALTEAYKQATLFPQVAELLQDCLEQGLAIGMVTSASRKQVEATVPQLGIENYFGVLITASDVNNYKPHPEPIFKALAALGKKPEETLMVGDSSVDIQAGKAAGTGTALFLPPSHARFYDFEELKATQPDFIFSDHRELQAYLKQNREQTNGLKN